MNFLLLEPKILLQQPNVLLIELNLLLLLQNIFVIPILTNDFVGITKPSFPCRGSTRQFPCVLLRGKLMCPISLKF